jgi:hypothetical protein
VVEAGVGVAKTRTYIMVSLFAAIEYRGRYQKQKDLFEIG